MLAKILDRCKKVLALMRAKVSLLGCVTGKYVQVYGRVIVHREGKIVMGNRVRLRGVHVPIELAAVGGGELRIGNNVFINGGCSLCAQESVIIGDNCLIGNYTLIMDTDFHQVDSHTARPVARPIRIEQDVWLAVRVTVLKGVTIGQGAVVAAGAVVTRDVEPYTLVGGVPARVIRRIGTAQDQVEARREAQPEVVSAG